MNLFSISFFILLVASTLIYSLIFIPKLNVIKILIITSVIKIKNVTIASIITKVGDMQFINLSNKGLISFKLLLITILLSISLFTVLILPSFAAYEVHSFNVQSSAYEKGLELDVAKRLVFTQNVIAKELENKNENTENTENKEVEETKTEEQPEVVSEKR